MMDLPAQISMDQLSKDWRKLRSALYDCDDISVKFFQEVFQNTEQCLRQCLGIQAIGKEFIPLITDAYSFVDADAGDHNTQIQAAKILTERMLYQYVVNLNVDLQNPSSVTIYILKTKRQLTVDFSDVVRAFPIVVEALLI